MAFSVEKIQNQSVIRCKYEKLDTISGPELKSQFIFLSKNGDNNFIVDLSEVKYCDSSGLSALLVGNRISKEHNGSLTLFGLQPAVNKIITISQLDKVLNITLDQNTALNK
jgi:anti-sigma B factor antagonist